MRAERAGVSWVGGRRVLVAGTGVAGRAAAQVLLDLGATVTVLDRTDSDVLAQLRSAGATIRLGDAPPPDEIKELDDIVVSPGVPPHAPLIEVARTHGVPVYSEPELAWRLRGEHAPVWLA